MKRFIFILFALFGVVSYSKADITLKGIVVDAKTKELLPYTNILISSTEAYMTDDSGYFEFTVKENVDSIVFTFLGYKDEVLKQRFFSKDSITVKMKPDGYMLQEFVIQASKKVKTKDTVAIRIFRNVVAHKDDNRPKQYNNYQYEEYAKTVASLYNIKDKILKKKILKPFRFVIENMDSTENGVKYVPLILKESITEEYYQKKPDKSKSFVKASKISGIEQLRFSELLDIAFDEVDIYDNQTQVNGMTFLLPFANGGLTLYRYYLVDSVKNADSVWIYQLAFVAKSKSDLLFNGRAWIEDSSFAITKIDLSIDKRANLNFVNDFMLKQRFEEVENKGWFKVSEERSTNIAFTKRKKAKSVRIYRSISRKDIAIDTIFPDTIFSEVGVTNLPNYNRQKDSFWLASRHDSLTTSEGKVYFLIDSLKRTKFYKSMSTLGSFFSSGFYKMGKKQMLEVGNLYQLISWNDVEGVRLRVDFRNNWRMSEWIRFRTKLAYGTKDKRIKYGAEISSKLPDKKKRYHSIGASYSDDYQRFSLSPNDLEYDYIYNSLLRTQSITDLVYIKSANLFYYRQWLPNFNTRLSFNYKNYQTIPGKIEFIKTLDDGTVVNRNKFQIFSPSFTMRATPGAKFLQTARRERFVKGNLPRITLDYNFSLKGFISDFSYHKLELLIEERLPTPIGHSIIELRGFKLFGEAPYPLLHVLRGNQSFLYEKDRFTNMNEGEFIADQMISFLLEHHFNGFFFNKIPLIKKLGLREVFVTKMAVGSLDKSKVSFTDLPSTLNGLNGFYAEVGFAIENIAKLLRVDFSWRLTQKDKTDIKPFRVAFSFKPSF
ncbi:MAG: carboxypeptidase-like regulatory domain-containing protein [Chitinophagales bacterium]|nr:carboxypeptidase-like regulatory domain-containing protein [Chitinophagales bacterium]